MSNITTSLLWKFKGSTGPFNILSDIILPCQVKLVREKLKEKFGLSESNSIDFLIYLDNNPDIVLSDYFILTLNSKIYTRRCAYTEATELISKANDEFTINNKNILSNDIKVTNNYNDRTNLDIIGTSDVSTTINNAAVDNNNSIHQESINNNVSKRDDDEDLKISSIINDQNYYDNLNAQDSLSKRYYRNRMLLINNGKVQETGNDTFIDKIKLPNVTNEFDEQITVDADYICHMCGERGHHIRNCVQPDGKRLSKKIRSATGIPTDFLTPIPSTDITKYEEVYLLKDGTFAIMREMEMVSGGAFFTKSVDQRIQIQLGIGHDEAQRMSRRFKCNICSCYFNNPVTTLCCGESYCLDCIVCKKGGNKELGKSIKCPKCNKIIGIGDLQSNSSLKKLYNH